MHPLCIDFKHTFSLHLSQQRTRKTCLLCRVVWNMFTGSHVHNQSCFPVRFFLQLDCIVWCSWVHCVQTGQHKCTMESCCLVKWHQFLQEELCCARSSPSCDTHTKEEIGHLVHIRSTDPQERVSHLFSARIDKTVSRLCWGKIKQVQ